MKKCSHGVDRNLRVPEGIWITEPIYRCSCCGSDFWFIEMMMWPWVVDGLAYTKLQAYEPKDKCRGCGGRMVEKLERISKADEPKLLTLAERLAEFKRKRRGELR